MARVAHFEITADDSERAAKFYSELFNWKINKWDGPMEYWLASTGEGDGIDGAIMPRAHNQAVINTINVTNLDEIIAKVKEAGGSIIGERQTIPDVGDFIYAKDTEGNVFGMMQPQETTALKAM